VLGDRPVLALVVLALAALTWPASVGSPVRRLGGTAPAASPSPSFSPSAKVPAVGPAGRRWLVSAGSGVVVAILLGTGPVGWSCAAGVALGVERFLRRHDVAARAGLDGQAVERELPGACDLLAVCLGAGLPLGTALAEVAVAVPGPVGERLREVAASLVLGTDPRRAWAAAPAELAPLGRVLIRAAESGSSVRGGLRALAAQSRAAAGARAEVAVRRAGVWILAPLGLCFLPAFVCLGVLPLVLGIAGNVFR
jgi:Flp pilus assembly protein TadB